MDKNHETVVSKPEGKTNFINLHLTIKAMFSESLFIWKYWMSKMKNYKCYISKILMLYLL